MRERINRRKLLRLAREESGQELVEFALVGLLLMTLLFGVFEFAYAMYAYHFTSYAAQEGARFAIVRGQTWSANVTVDCGSSYPGFTMPYNCTALSGDITNYIDSLATPGINVSNLSVNATWPGTTANGSTTNCTTYSNTPSCLVQVQVSYTFDFIPLMNLTSVTMNATSKKTILQ